MFPHLYAMKESHHLSADDMGAIIGKSRQTYLYKAQCGNFTPFECKALCRYFHKTFEYLFATMEEIELIDAVVADRMCAVTVLKPGTGADNQTPASDADGEENRQEGCL